MKSFRPMLSGSVTDNEQLNNLTYPVIVSPKLDGIRCLMHPELGAVTRTLKPIPNRFIQHELYRMLQHSQLDGELVCGDPTAPDVYRNTMTEVMTAHPDYRMTACTYFVFDSFSNICTPYFMRLERIKKIVQLHGQISIAGVTVKVLESILCMNVQDVLNAEERCLKEGYEGIMIRNINRPYKLGRSTLKEQGLLKLKRFTDADAEIIGFEPLQHNNNEATEDAFGNTKRSSHKENKIDAPLLGNLVVRCLDEPFAGVEFSIGTGFDQALRERIWNNRDAYLGQRIKFKYQAIGVKDKPRFPVFLDFRKD